MKIWDIEEGMQKNTTLVMDDLPVTHMKKSRTKQMWKAWSGRQGCLMLRKKMHSVSLSQHISSVRKEPNKSNTDV